jgi:hypothetical protein
MFVPVLGNKNADLAEMAEEVTNLCVLDLRYSFFWDLMNSPQFAIEIEPKLGRLVSSDSDSRISFLQAGVQLLHIVYCED